MSDPVVLHVSDLSVRVNFSLNELTEAFSCHAIMLLVWLTPFLAQSRRKLLIFALVLGRFALSEDRF